MSNYFIPKYTFKVMDYSANYSNPPPSLPKYLFIEIEDRNRECDDQIYSFFISLKNVYILKESLSLIIGNDIKEINIIHYEKEQLDNNYTTLKNLLGLPF